MDYLVMYLLSRRVLAYSSLASTNFPLPNLPSAAAVLWYLGVAFAVCSVIKKSISHTATAPKCLNRPKSTRKRKIVFRSVDVCGPHPH
nr:unnamed protein product [Callosobruchus chinensis]